MGFFSEEQVEHTKPSTRTLVSSSPATKVKSSMRTATPSLARALKDTATSSPPFLLCLVCSTCSSEKKTVVFSAKRGLMRTILSCRGVDISQTTSVQDQHTPSQAFPPGLGAPQSSLA